MLTALIALAVPALCQDQPAPAAGEEDRDAILDDLESFLGEEAVEPPPAAHTTFPNALNPRLTAFGDALVAVGWDGGGVDPRSGPRLRSFELDVRADVDPYAKAVAVLAVEQEDPLLEGEEAAAEEEGAEEGHGHSAFSATPEEVYIDLVALPAGFSARAGRFLLPFGLTNRMHPHDWPWPTAPLAFQETIGPHGISDTGAVLSWRAAGPGGVAFTAEGGAVDGTFFDPHGETPNPAWLGRAELFRDFAAVDLGLGASGHGRGEGYLGGADLLLRWKGRADRSVVVVAEAFLAQPLPDEEAGATDAPEPTTAWTATLQVQPARPLYLGLRADQVLPSDEQDGGWRYAGFLAWYTSEFLRLRGGAETTTDPCSWLANAQLTFVWGSHPVEPYWVNR